MESVAIPTFPDFLFFGMLREANWPRKTGTFKKTEAVDPRFVDFLMVRVAEMSVTLGAGSPKLAAQLLADIFRDRDWEDQPLGDLLHDLDPSPRVAAAPGQRPWNSIVTLRLAQQPDITKPELMPWEVLTRPQFLVQLQITCAQGLIWGLLHPEEGLAAIAKQNATLNERLPIFKNAGLKIDDQFSVPAVADAIANIEQFIDAYQQEQRPLIPLPAALAQSPQITKRVGH